MTAAVIGPPARLTPALPGAYQSLMSDMDLRQSTRKADCSEQPEMAKFSLRVTVAVCDTEQGTSPMEPHIHVHLDAYTH